MDYEERITSAQLGRGEEKSEFSIRPKTLAEYIGQKTATDNLKVFIEAAKMRGEPLDHVLFYGPPGLGKTTLAGIIANEMGVDIRITSGPAIERAGDLAAILTNLNENDVLFIDEIHRLNRSVEEVLYSAMEDYARYHHRQRPVSPLHPTGYREVHPDRSDDEGRQPECSAA